MFHTGSIKGVIELSDDNILSWGDNSLRLWDRKCQPLAALEGHAESVQKVLELRNGRFLSMSANDTLKLWDSDGKPLSILEGYTSLLNAASAIELGDSRILSWSRDDGKLRLWDRLGQPSGVLEGHAYCVDGAVELSDGLIRRTGTNGHIKCLT